ncbi:sigma-70 family RNA polymerase sigma factor [Actinomadura sp. J1-007]|nr:sigma-70 family RNA polymerase sigma factor [Actinomadura sp. J1-007]
MVVRAREGDGGAWARLVERYTSFLWAIARSYELNDADAADVVQTTWMRLVERIDAIEEPAATGRWLAVTARRESARTARRRGREAVGGVPPAAADASAAPERIVLARERLDRVAAAIEALPRRCRALLRLYALAPSHADLAAAMEMPAGSVTSARRRCMGRLERRLAR